MVDEVLKNLVDQFSDPFTCLRELVQNAMDAGTEQIEIKTQYLASPGGICLEIRDFGEGMNRDIIDGKLTRLFSSDKENDLTKIGKFGIGFVSVFSLKPELVIVDTGRDGEFWRIAFDGGTDFQLFKLHFPMEGTSVRVHKILPFGEYQEFQERCRETVAKWCRHSAVQISFNEQLINRPFNVDSVCQVQVQDPLGQFSVGLTNSQQAPFGLYNTGLTLTEGVQEHLSGVTFKILSNHLEHTLTRDAVVIDANYHKVMARLNLIVENDLFERVCVQLRKAPSTREKTAKVALPYLRSVLSSLSAAQRKRPFLKGLDGTDISLDDLVRCAKQESRLFATQTTSALAERAMKEGICVLPFSPKCDTAQLLKLLLDVPVVSLEKNLAISVPVARPQSLKAMEPHIRALLREARIFVTSVVLVEYPDSIADPDLAPCIFALGTDRLVRRFRRGFWGSKYLLPQQLFLDVNHPLVRKTLSRPENSASLRVAIYVLCKAALLNDGLDPGVENRLLKRLLERV